MSTCDDIPCTILFILRACPGFVWQLPVHLFYVHLVNLQVAFKLFGLIPGSVGLRGKVQPVGTGGDTVVSSSLHCCTLNLYGG